MIVWGLESVYLQCFFMISLLCLKDFININEYANRYLNILPQDKRPVTNCLYGTNSNWLWLAIELIYN